MGYEVQTSDAVKGSRFGDIAIHCAFWSRFSGNFAGHWNKAPMWASALLPCSHLRNVRRHPARRTAVALVFGS